MQTKPKQLSIEIEDGTKTELVERITIDHLSDLGDGVKEVVEDFIKLNEGAVIPPVCIAVREVVSAPS